MTDLRALLAPIRERLSAATPGPWESRVDDLTDDVDVVHDQEQVSFVATCGDKRFPRTLTDAEFIANAPTDLARLLAAIEAVEDWCMNLDAIEAAIPSSAENPNSSAGAVATVIRAALAAALGSDTTNQEGTQ